MIHKMRLHDKPFKKIKEGTKTVEVRLNDEKRQLIKIGDTIEFESRITGEVISTTVINLYTFDNFEELFNQFGKMTLGFEIDEEIDPAMMDEFYSKEDQDKYEALGIEIKLND